MPKSKVLSGLAIFSSVAILASGLAVAQDPIAKRKAIMKANGSAAKLGGQMIKGEAPFDAKKAAEIMSASASGWAEFAKLFPENSKTGGETRASPKIWQTRQDFEEKGGDFKKKGEAAAAAAARGPAEFKEAYGAWVSTCKGCHDTYWLPKN